MNECKTCCRPRITGEWFCLGDERPYVEKYGTTYTLAIIDAEGGLAFYARTPLVPVQGMTIVNTLAEWHCGTPFLIGGKRYTVTQYGGSLNIDPRPIIAALAQHCTLHSHGRSATRARPSADFYEVARENSAAVALLTTKSRDSGSREPNPR